jgi:hypothetical protein
VAQEGIEAFRSDDVGRNTFRVGGLLAIHPLDLETFFFKQAFIVSDELRQALERLGVLQRQRFHRVFSEDPCAHEIHRQSK